MRHVLGARASVDTVSLDASRVACLNSMDQVALERDAFLCVSQRDVCKARTCNLHFCGASRVTNLTRPFAGRRLSVPRPP